MKKKTKQQAVHKWLDIAVIGSCLLLIVIHLLDGQWHMSLWIGIATLWKLYATWIERRAVWAVKAVREVSKIVNDDTLCADAMVANIGEVVK